MCPPEKVGIQEHKDWKQGEGGSNVHVLKKNRAAKGRQGTGYVGGRL